MSACEFILVWGIFLWSAEKSAIEAPLTVLLQKLYNVGVGSEAVILDSKTVMH